MGIDWISWKNWGAGAFRVPSPALALSTLSPQVLSGTLLAEAVTWLFTSVLKGLQTHGQHDGCMASLVHLAFQTYEALVSEESMGTGWLVPVTWASS